MEEIWKNIEGYEGLYQVSNLGNIKSLRKNIILKPGFSGCYFFVNLQKFGAAKLVYVHRLVAKHFIPNPENKKEVNHRFFDKLDNRANSLEWCTKEENMHHAKVNGRFYTSEYQIQQTKLSNTGEKSKISKFKNSDIINIRILKTTGLTNKAIAKKYNVNRETIGYILRGKTWKHVK